MKILNFLVLIFMFGCSEKFPQNHTEILKIKCENGNSKACMELASKIYNKSKNQLDENALKYAKIACENENSELKYKQYGCFSAGIVYKEKFKLTNDTNFKNQAKIYLKKACNLEHKSSCYLLENLK